MIKLTPKNKSKLTHKPKEISLTLIKNISKSIQKIKMYIDNKKVHHKLNKNKIYYTPKKRLSSGNHKVKITLIDNMGRSADLEWDFDVNKKHSHEDKMYNFYFGNPHCHTAYSTGRGTPSEAFAHALDKGLNFLMISDHSTRFSKNSKWQRTEEEASKFNKKSHNFLALRGFEVSSSKLGDFNILGSNGYYRRIKDFNHFTNWLYKQNTNPIVAINHPHKYIESLNYSPDLDKFINFIEVGNGDLKGKYLNGEKYYYKLLDKGWHLGAINGQDNHRANWGDSDNLTVVISKSLHNKDFMEALENRRVYSSESRTLHLLFKANNCWMGSIVPHSKKVNFIIKAEDKKNPISKIEIVSNNAKVIKSKSFLGKKKAKLDFDIDYVSNRWYVVKVIYKNGFCGISSPIFTQ